MDSPEYAVHVDARGSLLPIELDEVPFVVRRLFWVRGSDPPTERGDHAVPCEELLVLLTGEVRVEHGHDADRPTVRRLTRPGESVHLRPGDHVRYVLSGPAATVLVLASESWVPR